MAPKSIWKDRKTGEIVAQDPQYDDAMAAEKDSAGQAIYEPASEREADEWEANPNPEEPFVANVQMPDDVDRALVDKIIAAGKSVNVDIPEGEAIRRAMLTRDLMKTPQTYTKATQGEDFEGIGDQIRTALEGAAGGLTMGIAPFLYGLGGDFIQQLSGKPVEFSADIQRRREANPIIAFGSDIGAAITQGGLSLLRNIRPAASIFTGEGLFNAAARGITDIDIPSRVANRVSAHITAEKLGTSYAGALRQAEFELADIATKAGAAEAVATAAGATPEAARVAARNALTAVEREIADVAKTTAKPTLTDFPIAKLTGKQAIDIAGDRAIRQRANFMLRDNAAETYKTLGFGADAAAQFAKDIVANIPAAAAGGATAGAIGGFTRGYGQALSSGEADSIGEALGVAALSIPAEAGKGAAFGAGLAAATPLAVGTIGATIRAVRGTLAEISERIYPSVGSLFNDVRPRDLKATLKAGKAVAESDLIDEVQRLNNSLQYQYDNIVEYVAHLDDIASRDFSATPVAAAHTALMNAIRDVRNKFMIRPASAISGTPQYDLNKLRKAMLDTEAERLVLPDGTIGLRVKLPPEIETLQQRLGEMEENLFNLQRAYNAMNNIVNPEAGRRLEGIRIQIEGAPLQPRAGGLTTPQLPYSPQQQSYARASQAFVSGEEPQVLFPGVASGMQIDRDLLTPKSIAARDALRELGERIDQKSLGPLADFAIPAFLANQAGLGIPEAAGVGLLTSQAPKILFNPKAAVESYTTLQKALAVSERASYDFAKFLTTRGIGATTFVKLLEDKGDLGNAIRGALGEKKKTTIGPRQQLTAKGATALYDADKQLIEKLSSGDALGNIQNMFGGDADAVEAAYPRLASTMMATIPRQVAFMNEKLPKQPETWDVNRMGEWKPTEKEIYSYGLYSRYIRDPDAIYLDIAKKNYVPDQAIEVLQKVYPARYSQLRQQLFDGLLEAKNANTKISGSQQKIIDRLLGQNTNGLSQSQIRKLQNEIVIPPAGKGGNFSSKLPQLEMEGIPR